MNEELHPTEKLGILSASLLDQDFHLIRKAGRLFIYLLFIWSEGTADLFSVLKCQDEELLGSSGLAFMEGG